MSSILFTGLMLCWTICDATALSFQVIENDGLNRRVLLVYDCGDIKQEALCLPHQEGFTGPRTLDNLLIIQYESDSSLADWRRRLESIGLRAQRDYIWNVNEKLIAYTYRGDEAEIRSHLEGRNRFEEVWLLSGGGDLAAGIGVGGALRDARITVRVPSALRLREAGLLLGPNSGANCISSCTVAFMGGLFRYIDEDATYQVHAASSAASLNDNIAEKILKRFLFNGGSLQKLANYYAEDARSLLRDMLVHFHNTLLLSFPEEDIRQERERRDRELQAWILRSTTKFPYAPDQLERDTNLFELEGKSTLQDIIMRVERKSIDMAIVEVRSILPQLGRRADAALAMVEAMYGTSSIKETNIMARETLLKMGYVTGEVR